MFVCSRLLRVLQLPAVLLTYISLNISIFLFYQGRFLGSFVGYSLLRAHEAFEGQKCEQMYSAAKKIILMSVDKFVTYCK